MRVPSTPRVEDLGLQTWMASVVAGFQGGMSPNNLSAESRRQVNTMVLGALAGGETFRIYACRQPVLVEAVILTSSTATIGSTSSANWKFELTVDGTAINGSGKATTTEEILADKQYDLAVAGNTRMVSGNVLKLTVTKTGAPTSLAAAKVEAHVVIQLRE